MEQVFPFVFGNDQKLDGGKAWKRGWHNIVTTYYAFHPAITGTILDSLCMLYK